MTSLFFSPQGRIKGKEFWLGWVVLTLVGFALSGIQNLAFEPQDQARLLLLPLQIAMIYPWVCVYGKRFHDAGKSAWMVLVVFGVQIVITIALVIAFVIPQVPLIQETFAGVQGGGQEAAREFQESPEFQEYQALMRDRVAIPTMIGSLTLSLVVAYVVSILKSDPDENRFGPPPGAAAASQLAA